MEDKVVVVGLGEMGSVFARGFLKIGYPVYPVTRGTSLTESAAKIPNPRLVIVAVAESDIHTVIKELPKQWHPHVVLLQNELLPRDWQASLDNPTVISVWFEKKKGQDSKVIIPSPVYGPNASLVKDALASLDISCRVLDNKEQLLFELVRKNVYILTSNISGLAVGGTVSELWSNHRELATNVVEDVLKIQEQLTQSSLIPAAYIQGMVDAFAGDPDHKCMGRSAPQRLSRAIQQANEFGIDVPTLSKIQAAS